MARLLRAAETAKIALSARPTARVQEEYLLTAEGRTLHLDVEVQREEFESVIADMLDGTIQSFDAALRDAGIAAADLDKVLFVGGSTRIPLVWDLVREHTGIEPAVAINPDEAVALGAAVQAAIIAGEPLDAILVDVTSHSLGIEIAELELGRVVPDHYSVIIPRNTTIPTSRAEVYSAIHPGQTAIDLKIYQGEHPVASQNALLGEFRFDQLRPEAPGMPPRITVQFDFDLNGIVHVSAADRGNGKQISASLRAAHARLSPADIAGARVDLEELELAGWDEGALQVPLLESPMVSTVGMSLETIGLLARGQRTLAANPGSQEISRAIDALEAAARQGDADALEASSEALLDLLYDLDDE
jgi:molecular chaperone DnaK